MTPLSVARQVLQALPWSASQPAGREETPELLFDVITSCGNALSAGVNFFFQCRALRPGCQRRHGDFLGDEIEPAAAVFNAVREVDRRHWQRARENVRSSAAVTTSGL